MPKSKKRAIVKTKKPRRQATTAMPAVEEPTIAKPTTRLAAIVYDGMLILALLFLVGTVLTVIGTLLTMQTGTESAQARSLPVWYQNIVIVLTINKMGGITLILESGFCSG